MFVVASCAPPTGDLAHNPGSCPDQESNQRPFDLQVGTQSTELYQPGQKTLNILVSIEEIESFDTESVYWIPGEK